MKKIILGLIISLSVSGVLFAQDENDAIRYGYTNYFGTARGMAIGSALGSVGGDFSTLSVNPAGIGIFRKSEFSFTPSFSVNHNEATYQGNNAEANRNKFNLSQFGLVLTKAENNLNSHKKWKSVSFAFGMNRQQNFTNSFTYSGKNNQILL